MLEAGYYSITGVLGNVFADGMVTIVDYNQLEREKDFKVTPIPFLVKWQDEHLIVYSMRCGDKLTSEEMPETSISAIKSYLEYKFPTIKFFIKEEGSKWEAYCLEDHALKIDPSNIKELEDYIGNSMEDFEEDESNEWERS